MFVGENYRLAGLLTVFSYGAAAVLALFLREVHPSQARTASHQLADFAVLLRQLARSPRLLLLVLAAAFLNEAHQTITTFLNQVQYTRAGLSASAIAVVYVVMTLLGLCGGFSARLTCWLGERRTGGLLLGLAAAACLALTLTQGPLVSVAAIFLLRVCHSLFTPLQTTLQNRQVTTGDPGHRAEPECAAHGHGGRVHQSGIRPGSGYVCRWPWASALRSASPDWCCIWPAAARKPAVSNNQKSNRPRGIPA